MKNIPPKPKSWLNALKRIGVFDLHDAQKAGFSQPTISRLAANNFIIKLGSAFYVHPEAEYDPSTLDLVIACKKFGPTAFISGLSALYYYRLIDEVPDRVWVVVPQQKRTTDEFYRLIRSKREFHTDIEQKDKFRIASLCRTLIESLHYASKIGVQTVIGAIRRALNQKRVTQKSLFECSRRLGLMTVLEKYWDLITVE